MMVLRKIVTIILCIAALSVTASAHPGRTDSEGGHLDRGTGNYHYHHGKPAHNRCGNECPYRESEQETKFFGDVINKDVISVFCVLGGGYAITCGIGRLKNRKK
jgi:hypothetical protein